MKISVVVTSYNHEKYIDQCMESVLNQTGDFSLEIILGDDCSTDRTGQILDEYQRKHPEFIFKMPAEKNLGITKNLKRCLDACTGDYIAICEGDDYWTHPEKLQKQMQLLEKHIDYSMCFSVLTLYYEEEERSVLYFDQVDFPRDEVTIEDLIEKNLIGNFSCCMYRARVVHQLSPELFDMFTVDWMFNMACSEFGKIGFIRETLSVYRKHANGAWTGKSDIDQVTELIELVKKYNQFFNYRYNDQFQQNLAVLIGWLSARVKKPERVECDPIEAQPLAPNVEGAVEINPVEVRAEITPTEEAFPIAVENPDPSSPLETETRLQPEGLKYSLIALFKNTFRPYWRLLIKVRNILLAFLTQFLVSIRSLSRRAYRKFRQIIFDWEHRNNFWGALIRACIRLIRRSRITLRRFQDRYFMKARDTFQPTTIPDLLILDTVFPHPLSPFRFHEFNDYLTHFPNSIAFADGHDTHLLGETRIINEVIKDYEMNYPQFRGRVLSYKENMGLVHGSLAYATFLNNMKLYIDLLELRKIPFVFTLYPGGGFQLNEPESDLALNRILKSPQFRKVIVTQKITYDYLINNCFCTPDQIEFIYGVVSTINSKDWNNHKERFGFGKDELDICFVAYKYTEKGVDKGYDVFIECARQLSRLHDNIRFHVVGNFSAADLPIDDLNGKITFYGLQKRDWLIDFFKDKDIILSPNKPFLILKGSFDGFPTSGCTDAGMEGVAIFCTDDLCQNIKFIDHEDIIIIPHDADIITNTVDYYFSNPGALRKLAERGADKVRDIYGDKNQLEPRRQVIAMEMNRISGDNARMARRK